MFLQGNSAAFQTIADGERGFHDGGRHHDRVSLDDGDNTAELTVRARPGTSNRYDKKLNSHTENLHFFGFC